MRETSAGTYSDPMTSDHMDNDLTDPVLTQVCAMPLDAPLDMTLGAKAFRKRSRDCGSDCDRQIDLALFSAIQGMIGTKFTVDAAADDYGDTAMCKRFCCPSRSFMITSLQPNDVVWMNAPFRRVGQWLTRYQKLKAKDPSLSACILVPKWRDAPFMRTLTAMQARPLTEYARGTRMFAPASGEGERLAAPCKWPIQVWYDPPGVRTVQPVAYMQMRGCSKPSMQFAGRMCGTPASVLFDTGATHNFIDAARCQALGLPILPSRHDTVRVGDGNLVTLRGQCTVRLNVQGFQCKVTALVMDGLSPTSDLVLGDPFMIQYNAVLKPSDGSIVLDNKGRAIVIRRVTPTDTHAALTADIPDLHDNTEKYYAEMKAMGVTADKSLSAKEAVRLMRSGKRCWLMYVSSAGDMQTVNEPVLQAYAHGAVKPGPVPVDRLQTILKE